MKKKKTIFLQQLIETLLDCMLIFYFKEIRPNSKNSILSSCFYFFQITTIEHFEILKNYMDIGCETGAVRCAQQHRIMVAHVSVRIVDCCRVTIKRRMVVLVVKSG